LLLCAGYSLGLNQLSKLFTFCGDMRKLSNEIHPDFVEVVNEDAWFRQRAHVNKRERDMAVAVV
jgi:hypothetical protein